MSYKILQILSLGLWCACQAVAQQSHTHSANTKKKTPRDYAQTYQRPHPMKAPHPQDNPPSPEKELLGRTLFFDPRLSASSWISCASCHNPALAWGDGLAKGLGHDMKPLGRRTPTVLNLGFSQGPFFWDGRAATLEEQALGPIASPAEMNLPLKDMVGKLQGIEGYKTLFEKAFPKGEQTISETTVSKALACFERTLVSQPAPFDRWVSGEDNAISEEAKAGFLTFNENGHCAHCHSGWRFTDDSFRDLGLLDDDMGRGQIVAQDPKMAHAFKVPTLRNVDQRGPYMHNGSQKSLLEVIGFYNRGGDAKRPSVPQEHIFPLALNGEEMLNLVAFLKTLTSEDTPVIVPTLPH